MTYFSEILGLGLLSRASTWQRLYKKDIIPKKEANFHNYFSLYNKNTASKNQRFKQRKET